MEGYINRMIVKEIEERVLRGGFLMKQKMAHQEGVKPVLLNGVAGEAVRLNSSRSRLSE